MTETTLQKIVEALAQEPSKAVRREILVSVFGPEDPDAEPFAVRLEKALAIPHVAPDDDSPVYEFREVIALKDRDWVRVNDPRKAVA